MPGKSQHAGRSAQTGRFVQQRSYAEKARAYIEGKVSYTELSEAARDLAKSAGAVPVRDKRR